MKPEFYEKWAALLLQMAKPDTVLERKIVDDWLEWDLLITEAVCDPDEFRVVKLNKS